VQAGEKFVCLPLSALPCAVGRLSRDVESSWAAPRSAVGRFSGLSKRKATPGSTTPFRQVPQKAQAQPRARLVGRSNYTDADLILANAGAGRRQDGRGTQAKRAQALIYVLLDGGGEIEAKVAYAAGVAPAFPR
jgi:hypothetical protein